MQNMQETSGTRVPANPLGRAGRWVWVGLDSVNGKTVPGHMFSAGGRAQAEPVKDWCLALSRPMRHLLNDSIPARALQIL